jgi:predicted nucleic-acid-binding protein
LSEIDEKYLDEILETTQFLVKQLQERKTKDMVALIAMSNVIISMVAVLEKRNKREGENLRKAVEEYFRESWGKL